MNASDAKSLPHCSHSNVAAFAFFGVPNTLAPADCGGRKVCVLVASKKH
jgi:hypothetical protein